MADEETLDDGTTEGSTTWSLDGNSQSMGREESR
jgi:hypothetical protein